MGKQEKQELTRKIDTLEGESLLLKAVLKDEYQYHSLRTAALARELHRRGIEIS